MYQQIKEYVEQTPDSIKIAVAAAPPVGTYIFGLSLQEWTYVLSILLTILFIIEKIPKAYASVKLIINKIKKMYASS